MRNEPIGNDLNYTSIIEFRSDPLLETSVNDPPAALEQRKRASAGLQSQEDPRRYPNGFQLFQ